MRTPLVLSLVGVDLELPMVMKKNKIEATSEAILRKHKTITPENIKDIPFRLADPTAVFQTSTDSDAPEGSIVVMTDIKDANGATVIVPIHPSSTTRKGSKKIFNIAASMYPQADKSGQPKNKWFREQVEAGRLLYINQDKAAQWHKDTGEWLIQPGEKIPEGVKTQDDLSTLWQQHKDEGFYYTDPVTGEHTSRIDILGLGRSMVQLLTNSKADEAAHIHDIGHAMFGIIDGLAEQGHSQMIQDRDYVLSRAGVTLEQWLAEKPNQRGGAREKAHEWFAKGFEVYISEGGKAPNAELQDIFDRARKRLLEIYDDIQNQLGITLNDTDRAFFERLLTIQGRDTDTVAETAQHEARIKQTISDIQRQQRVLEEQHQRNIQQAVDPDGSLNAELDDNSADTVENYIQADYDFEPDIEHIDNTARIRTVKGTEAEVRYKIVEADSLITSHTEAGDINEAYPQELQPRERDRMSSIKQINTIANNLDPEMLGSSRLASDGAPIVGNDSVVESGNGRVLAIRQAYKSGKGQKYRQWLINNAYKFGLFGEDAETLNQPVLIRERISDVDRTSFAAEANESTVAGMSLTENAASDSKKITNDMLARFNFSKPLYQNTDFINAFSQIIPEADMGQFIRRDGGISTSGLNRIVAALMAKAFNDPLLLDRITESYDNNMRNISNAIVAAAPSVAILQNSNYNEALFIGDDVVQAVHTLDRLQQEGKSVQSFLSQPDLFGDGISNEAKSILEFLDNNKNSYRRMAAGLINYVNIAMNEAQEGQGLLFEDSTKDKSTILNEAFRAVQEGDASSYVQEPINSSFFERLNSAGKVEPTVPVNSNTFNAFLAITGPEGAMTYLKKRRRYLKTKGKNYNPEAELERIEHFIGQLNDTFKDELQQKNVSIITPADLRTARSEGKAEGRSIEKSIQQQKREAAEARLRERYESKLQASTERRRDNLQELRQQKNERIAEVQEKGRQEKAELREDFKQEKAELREGFKQEKAELREDFKQARQQARERLKESQQKMREQREKALTKKDARYVKKMTQLQRRIDTLSGTIRDMHSRSKIKSMVKRMTGMLKSQSISWNSLQELRQLVDSFSRDKDEHNVQRRELLRQFLEFGESEEEGTADLVAEFAEEMNITPEEIDEFSSHTFLEDMTVAEVKELFKAAQNIYRQGRAEYVQWKEQRQQRRLDLASSLAADIESSREAPKPKTPTKRQDLMHQYKLGALGEYAAIYGDSIKTPRRFLRGLGDSFTDILFDRFTPLINDAARHIHQREEHVLGELLKLGIAPTDFMNAAITIDDQTYTWGEAVEVYLGMMNEFSRNAILYGNFMSNLAFRHTLYINEQSAMNAINKILELVNQPENERFRKAGHILMQDFADNVDRIEQAQIRDFNKGIDRQQYYTPIFRLRYQTSGGFMINDETEQLIADGNRSALFQRVENGFTQRRMHINPEKQQPIELNAFANWSKGMHQQEYAAALGGYAADVFSALTTTTDAHESVQSLIQSRVGDHAWSIIKSIFNNTVNDNLSMEAMAADKILGALIRNRSFAYVAFNPNTILKQFGSFFATLPLSHRGHLFRSFAKAIEMGLTGRTHQFLESVYELYPELRFSVGDPVLRTASEMRKFQPSSKAARKYTEAAYKGTAVLDNWTKAIVFDAVYQSRLEMGDTQEEAVKQGIIAVQDTQPASKSREMTEFNRSKGLNQLLLFQFMNSLAPLFNVAVFDVAHNLASKSWNGIAAAAWSLLGIALSLGYSGLVNDAFNGKLPSGEERPDGSTDDWSKWTIDTLTENFLNMTPVLNSILVGGYRRLRGKKSFRGPSRLEEPFEAASKLSSSVMGGGREEFDGIDWMDGVKAASLLGIKIPYSGTKLLLRFLGFSE